MNGEKQKKRILKQCQLFRGKTNEPAFVKKSGNSSVTLSEHAKHL